MSEEFFAGYQDALSEALDQLDGINYVVSSDSIVLYSPLNHEEGLVEVTRAAARTMSELLAIGVPLRGAISFGPFREGRTPRGTIIAGQPILEAMEYEKKQDWLGVILCPTVLEHNPHISRSGNLRAKFNKREAAWTGGHLVRRYDQVPFQDGAGERAEFRTVVVLPSPFPENDSAAVKAKLTEALQHISAMETYAPDPRSQRKYAATRNFLTWAAGQLVDPAGSP